MREEKEAELLRPPAVEEDARHWDRDPGIEWVPVAHSLLAVESYRGFDGVRRFWGEFLSTWESTRLRL